MDDYKYRQKVINAMYDLCKEGSFKNNPHIDDIIKAIEGIPLDKSEWIPVSERLPEERDWYLAVFKESDTEFQLIPRVADYIGMGENNWQLMDEDSLPLEYRKLLECIAWMPLPEPYKSESEEV